MATKQRGLSFLRSVTAAGPSRFHRSSLFVGASKQKPPTTNAPKYFLNLADAYKCVKRGRQVKKVKKSRKNPYTLSFNSGMSLLFDIFRKFQFFEPKADFVVVFAGQIAHDKLAVETRRAFFHQIGGLGVGEAAHRVGRD